MRVLPALAVVTVLSPGLFGGSAHAQTAAMDEPLCRLSLSARTSCPAGTRPVQAWSLSGELVDKPDVVCGFLGPVIESEKIRCWDDGGDALGQLDEYLTRFGYHVSVRESAHAAGGIHLSLALSPVTQIRHVVTQVEAGFVDRIINPVFSLEILRRMTLRPGSPLDANLEARRQQLQDEADRLAYYLRGEGFFESEVNINESAEGKHTARLDVLVTPGPAYTVGRLTVLGNNAVESSEIVKLFKHRRLGVMEARFTREQLQKDVQRVVDLYQKRGFPGARVRTDFDMRQSFKRESKTVEFTIEVRERRKIDVVFEGIDKGTKTDDLLKELTLNEEGSYDDVELDNSAESIRRWYQRNGRFEATVTWSRERFGVFERVVFNVDEGPRLPVREIVFSGNRIASTDELRGTIKTRIFREVIIGESGGYLTSLQLEQDVGRILEHYRLRGYPNARVTPRVGRSRRLLGNAAALAATVVGDVPSKGLYVLFQIDEGERVELQGTLFRFCGEHTVDETGLRGVLQMRPGAAIVEEQIREEVKRIEKRYFVKGFPRAEVTAQVVAGSAPDRKIILYEVTENLPATIGKTALRGNFRTRDWVIRDELGLLEGKPLTIKAAEEAQANLRRSGLFSAVRIDYEGLDAPDQEVVNVRVSVQERHDNAGELQAGFGYATDTKLFGELGYKYQNIGGIGASFQLRGVLGQEAQLAEGKLVFPQWIMRRLFKTPFLLELTSFFQIEKTPRFGDLTSLGASVAATKQGRRGIFEGWLLSLRYNFRRRNRDEDLVRVAGSSDDIQRSKIVTVSSTVGPQLVIDKRRDEQGRRNPLTPTSGFRLELRTLFGENFLVGSDRFIKVGGSGQHFIKFGGRFLITNGIRYDQGFPLDGAVVLPEVERFFSGGDNTVRGFEEDRMATELIEDDAPPLGGVTKISVRPAGGNIRIIHNLELQVDLFEWKVPFASAIFLDSGLVTNSFDGVHPDDLRHGLGVALLRAVAPFGALSVEYAIPLDPERGDNPKGRFHVNIGLLF